MLAERLLCALLLVVGFASGEGDLCPKMCVCGKRALDGELVAKCTALDHNSQRFSTSIQHLVLRQSGLPPSRKGEFTLDEKLFVNLGLDHVRSVTIVNSHLSTVDPNAFHGLNQLVEVDLSGNSITHLHPDTFKGNMNLRRLKLNGNPLEFPVGNSTDYFLESLSLKEIDLSRCGISHLTPGIFSRIDRLDVIILKDNVIEEIGEDAFKEVALVTDLVLANNRIFRIHPDAFFVMEDLHTLDLSGNPLQTLQGIDLEQVVELDVSRCQFRSLNASTFAGLSEVTHLNLSDNAIDTLDIDAFDSISDLEYLYLSRNRLRGPLPEDLFENNKNLEVISLSGNTELERLGNFRGEFNRLYHLDLSDCGIGELSESNFRSMHYIAYLNLSRNHLQEIPVGALTPLRHLNVFDLSHNKLRQLPKFRENRELKRLTLSDNLLHKIDPTVFTNTTKLYLLDLKDNRLTTLWDKDEGAVTLKNLAYLNLAGNRLRTLRKESFAELTKLEKLDITGNPIKCGAEFARAIEWLIVHKIKPNSGKKVVAADGGAEVSVAWDNLTRKVCPPSEMNTVDDSVPEDVITVTVQESTDIEASGRFEKLEIVDVEERLSLWPMLLIAILCMCVLFVVFNIVGLLVSRSQRRYNLVAYKSQLPNPLGGRVRQPTAVPAAGHHVYHKLYEECSVPNTPATPPKSLVAYLSGALNRNPPEQV